MCGIVGYYGGFDAGLLPGAIEAMRHRGPDSSGIYRDAECQVGLGHTRLAIIDVSVAGHQPMASADGNFVLIFNGEIYNYRELRQEVVSDGYNFRGNSDTEVLLALYIKHGPAMLGRLNGIFAFAVWDRRGKELVLVRDGMGVKPLYFCSSERGVAFASELKALLTLNPDHGGLDPEAMRRYMTFLWEPSSATMLKGVRKLQPGQAVAFRLGKFVHRWTWYKLPLATSGLASLSYVDAVSGAEERLRIAVQRQLVSDVPVGAFLSGGLDSSAVVTFAREINPDIHCFTIRSTGEGDRGITDDLPYAERVARHLGVRLDVVEVDPNRMASDLEFMVSQLDEPLADFAPLNVFYISQLARSSGIKVMLSGAGGDDLFTGYRRHRALRLEAYWDWMPQRLRLAISIGSRFIGSQYVIGRKIQRLLSGVHLEGNERLIEYFRWTPRGTVDGLFSSGLRNQLQDGLDEEPMLEFLEQLPPNLSQLQRMLALEQRFFLSEHNLIYTDKMSMAAGVETRVPFLDPDLVQFAANIPTPLSQGLFEGKRVLKSAMEKYLPYDVVHRPKTGFGVPLRRWMKHELRSLVGDLLSKDAIQRRGILDPVAVNRLIVANDRNKIDASYTLLSLVCMELWCRTYLDKTHDGPGRVPSIPVSQRVRLRPTASRVKKGVQRPYQVCCRCVMDTSDSRIVFDRQGVCDHCHTFDQKIVPQWQFGLRTDRALEKLSRKIKLAGEGRDYDCIIGMSGGIDSSYLTYIAKEKLGLRPLVFHVDAGWNSDVAVGNIEKMVAGLGLDLFTEVIDWEEMRDLQLAFFKSGVPHIDAPQDHAFFATMYKFAERHNVKYMLTGANMSTECIRNPIEWMYYQSDSTQLRDIHLRFGERSLNNFPVTSILRHKLYLPYIRGLRVEKPLDLMPYVKKFAVQELSEKFNWRPYPQKHFESRFTKFYEGYWLPEKFGFDTRRVQFSSLILTGQMDRKDAMAELERPAYDSVAIARDLDFVAAKLRISRDELRRYFDAPNRSHRDYRSQEKMFSFGAKMMRTIGLERGGKR